MAWLGRSFGDSVSSLTGQLSNLTKDILTEGTEEVSDHATELSLAKEQIITLQSTQASQRTENERLKKIIRELEEKAESAELQINSISRQYRTQLEDRERDINTLKQHHHELLEHNAKEAALHSPPDTGYTGADAGRNAELQNFQEGFDDWSNESWGDFDDSLRLQREINQLRQEVARLRTDSQHWRSVAAQLSQQRGDEGDQSAHHDLLNLQARVKELEKTASDSREQGQHELASLQDVHHSKMAALKKRHKEDVTQLRDQIVSLERQLADARDGSTSSVLPESERAESETEKTLRAQLAAMTAERDKTQTSKVHLQAVLEELQGEVESLHTLRDGLQGRVEELQHSLHTVTLQHRQQIASLQTQLEEAGRGRQEAAEERHQENELKSSIAEVGTQLQQTSEDTENLIEELGSEQAAKRTAAAVDSLERENLSLREQCAKFQEQSTLLERKATNQQEEWQRSQHTVTELRRELDRLRGGTSGSSDNTLDQSVTTATEAESVSPSSQKEGELDGFSLGDWETQRQALEQVVDELRQQVRDRDDQLSLLSSKGPADDVTSLREEKERLEGELSSVREEKEILEGELSSVREEKEDLESSIGELDEQHQEATTHLIAARNTLQSQLTESQLQVKALQEELQNLQDVNQASESSPPGEVAELRDALDQAQQETQALRKQADLREGEVAELRAALDQAQQETQALRKQAELREGEVADLKMKLQSNALALNDLHMDKKELEEELTSQKDQVQSKVAAIKTLREEKSGLTEDNQRLTQRLDVLEEELESWQQRNEQTQLDRGHLHQLTNQLVAQQGDNSAMRQKMDALFLELEQSRQRCTKMEQERERWEQGGDDVRQGLVQDREAALQDRETDLQDRETDLQDRETALQDRDSAETKVAELEKQLASIKETHTDPTEMSALFSQKMEDLETQVHRQEGQLESLSTEKRALEDQVWRLREESNSGINHEDDLRICHQNLATMLEKRCTVLNALKGELDSEGGSCSVSDDCVSDLCTDSHSLLEALVSGNSVLEQIQQQHSAGSSQVGEPLLTQSSASHPHASWGTQSSADSGSLQAENLGLSDAIGDKDSEIVNLHKSLNDVQEENATLKQSVSSLSERLCDVEQGVTDRDGELKVLHSENQELRALCEDSKVRQADTDIKMASLKTQLQETEAALRQAQQDLSTARTTLEQVNEVNASHLQQHKELESARERIQQLQNDLSKTSETLSGQELEIEELNAKCGDLRQAFDSERTKCSRQEEEIEELNAKCGDLRQAFDSERTKCSRQEQVISKLRQSCVAREEELVMVKSQLNTARKTLPEEESSTTMDKASDLTNAGTDMESACSVSSEKQTGGEGGVMNGEVQSEGRSELSAEHAQLVKQLSAEQAQLVKQLQEREETIADLQHNNATLLQMLEAKSLTSLPRDSSVAEVHQLQSEVKALRVEKEQMLAVMEAKSLTSLPRDSSVVEVHQLQSEVKALRVEKEQMLAVMEDKSREASSLKAEVMRLMSVVSAEKSALDKLSRDNQELMARPSPPRDDSLEDMTREAMHNLSRLVRDRELEIEALTQKNQTLMAVLQDMDQGGGNAAAIDSSPSLASHFADKENLQKQLAALQGEREQMVAFVNQKHSESVAYHREIQRLVALRAEEVKRLDQLQSDYDALCPQFEDKAQALLKAQNDLISCRHKYADLEVRHGELLQKANASQTVDAASFNQVRDEKERLAAKQTELHAEIHSREEKVQTLTERLKEAENRLAGRESEAGVLKKQVDSLQFQLQGVAEEAKDLRQERQSSEHQHRERQEEGQALKELNAQLTLSVREKEFEVSSLQERVIKLTSLVSEQQGEKTQVSQLLKEQEELSSLRAGLQQEVDQLTLALKQKQQQLNDIHAENLRLKEREHRLSRELDRLRSHLLQIEEGYTREALEAEEREKSLRNRLAVAEEQLTSATSQVQSASHDANQQVESLQQQLHTLANQRDSAYMQVSSLQEQSQQYSTSLANLQIVLEQFQREKESQIAVETERYQEESRKLREQTAELEHRLQQTRVELEEASDGLAAASRLSEQLDRKEEALEALREEVHHREAALRTAEEEVHKLTSSKEAKVDSELMKNLLLGYFHTPDRNRMDAIHAIGSVLGFTQQDFNKIDEGHSGGWMSGLFRRGRPSPSTPTHHPGRNAAANQSFSQLFVKFLEVESTPPPAPVRLPAEEMAREANERHHVTPRDNAKPQFNPFTAPRHVAMPIAVGTAATTPSSHLLMSPPSPSSPTTTFPMFTPFSSTPDGSSSHSSSAILKDVLGSR